MPMTDRGAILGAGEGGGREAGEGGGREAGEGGGREGGGWKGSGGGKGSGDGDLHTQLFAYGGGGWEGGRGSALFQRTLADQEAALPVPFGPGDHLVPCHAAPGGKLDLDGGVGGEDLQKAAVLYGVDVTADEQKEAAAAVEVTAVEANVGLVYVSFDRVHERLAGAGGQ